MQYIGIDNGTQGTKCVVFCEKRGGIIASAYRPHRIIEDNSGKREQNPEWWIEAASEALGECLSSEGVKRSEISGIGVSGQQHGCVALDKNGEPLCPAKLWCDTETVRECEEIIEAAGGARIVSREIGNSVAVGFTASKVRWMLKNRPQIYDKTVSVMLPHDYLNFWLTGEKTAEPGDASGTAYFDIRHCKWSEIMLSAVDPTGRLGSCLPRLIKSHEPAGTIRPQIAKRFGLSSGVIVSSGGGDNMIAAIGTGNVVPGVVTASFGTSGTICASSEKPITDPRGEIAAFCSSTGAWLPLICTMNVTVATERTRELFGMSLEEFNKAVASADPGSGGIILHPYFNGERTPALPNARAMFSGISSSNFTRENMCRAAMEGATLGLRYGLEALRRRGIAPTEIRLVGGGAKSSIWRVIAANVFNCRVVCPENTEAGATGAALQAMWCRTVLDGGNDLITAVTGRYCKPDESSAVEPVRELAALYEDVYAAYSLS